MQTTMPIEVIYEKARLTLEKHKHIKVVNLKVKAHNEEHQERFYVIAKVRREEDGGVELLVDDLEAYLDQNIWLDAQEHDPYIYFHKRNKANLEDIEVADGARDENEFEPIDITDLDPYSRWDKGEINAAEQKANEEAERMAKEAEADTHNERR